MCPQLAHSRWTEGPLAQKQPLRCLVTPFSTGGRGSLEHPVGARRLSPSQVRPRALGR